MNVFTYSFVLRKDFVHTAPIPIFAKAEFFFMVILTFILIPTFILAALIPYILLMLLYRIVCFKTDARRFCFSLILIPNYRTDLDFGCEILALPT
jgi:hypothetical protein